ncbi:MAG: TIGR00730 family Rossman fold protein [Chitinophagaceae bacterium]|nr:TIGR00730 family Rossman fold protein [Chitinophagaceae bacterium]
MQINSLAVFCGSKSGNNPLYEAAAKALGHLLASKKITLIYGGGNKGIMGAVSNAVLEKDGKVVGIIPEILKDREHHHKGITYEKCDAAIILPGGFGTMDEFFEMLTWNQLSIHDKKIFILNTAGFYNHLLAFAQTMQDEGFLYDNIEDKLVVLNQPAEMLEHL